MTRRLVFTALAVVLFTLPAAAERREEGNLVLDGVPEIPQRIVDKTNQYMNVRSASFSDWIPGGGLLISTRFGETRQLHRVEKPGGARRQLTFFHEPAGSGSFGNDPGWFLFTKDAGGNEASQIFRYDLSTGEAVMLTDGEAQNGGPVWSNARDRIAWRSTTRNKRDHDIRVMDPLHPGKERIALETEGYWFPMDWSPDDRFLLIGNYISITESYFWILDAQTGEKRPVGNHGAANGATISYGDALFGAGGDEVFYTSDEGTEYRTLRVAPVGSTDAEELSGAIPWGVGSMRMSEDRTKLAFTVNADGADQLFVMDTRSREYRAMDLPLGILGGTSFSEDGSAIAITFTRPSAPGDVYTIDLESGELTRWTESEVGGLDTSLFRDSELVHFPTFDNNPDGSPREIPAFLYKPAGEGPFPVVMNIHGGPESQSRAWFSYTTQYLVNELGCAVIYPNVRGSNGYGKSYLKLDNGFLREDSVKDIGALLDWIAAREDLDEGRVGVMGGSYGGYMSLAALTHYSDRLRAGVDIVGISNFVTFLTNTKDYRRDLRRAEYGDERDPAMHAHLEKISPTNHVTKISVPLFVIQGANDPRVPASEAEQIVTAVRESGREAWYMLALDEGHGFRKKTNRDAMGYALALFWETYLLQE
ncbi:MAG: alpha/beta fold hydrolase [Gemmatimonadota bacterium]|jgi:dipeptidyl aminopeptidase/acylaminoacyl peptidase|nr:alpha/beta fold hydrolase [Gemmatimonadota bacterium]